MTVELNLRTIQALIKALSIASAVTEEKWKKDRDNAKFVKGQEVPVYLANQATLIDSIEEYHKLLDEFQILESRLLEELGEELKHF